METKWIVKVVSGSWVMTEEEVAEFASPSFIEGMKEDAQASDTKRAKGWSGGRSVECAIIK